MKWKDKNKGNWLKDNKSDLSLLETTVLKLKIACEVWATSQRHRWVKSQKMDEWEKWVSKQGPPI